MAEKLEVKELDQVVVRFSGDSGESLSVITTTKDVKPDSQVG